MIKTVSLELAKQLREAGYPQKTEFFWQLFDYQKVAELTTIEQVHVWNGREWAAPTAEEILDVLPDCTIEYSKKWIGIFCKAKDDGSDISLAEAAGKLWLYLKKENLI